MKITEAEEKSWRAATTALLVIIQKYEKSQLDASKEAPIVENVRDLCEELLGASGANGCSGCSLCRS